MTILHMQTETVHSTAQQMKRTGEQTVLAVQSLNRVTQSLQASWQGGSSEAFGIELQDLLHRLDAQADFLLELAARVDREASEWEETDRSGFDGQSGMVAAGSTSSDIAARILPIIGTVVLPPWLVNIIHRLFPPHTIISPVVDEPIAPAPSVIPTTNATDSAQPRSKLGELMDKAKEEEERKKAEQKLAEEKQKADEAAKAKEAEKPKPAHISEYPAREADGTYLVGQEKDDSCSIASTKMVLKRLDIDASESDLREASHKIENGYENNKKWGTTPSTLDDLVNSQYGDKVAAEYKASQSVTDLQTAASDGKGIVVSVNNSEWFGSSNAHSVTVVGVTTENGKQMVLVNDPWPPGVGKRLSVPAEDFQRAWYGDAMYVSKK